MSDAPCPVRDAGPADADAIAAIYNHYVLHTWVTFELDPVDAPAMQARIDAVQALGLPWLVAADETGVHGYAYATTWKPRPAYARTVETTVYLAPPASGRGLGRALYRVLDERLQAAGMHVLIGGIALPNAASVGLHEAMGYRHVGTFHETGFKFGQWIDVGYWQRTLAPVAAR